MKIICKKCGNDKLFYTKEKYSGTCNFFIENDGSPNETGYNADMYVHTVHKLKSIYYYCYECNSKVKKIPLENRF